MLKGRTCYIEGLTGEFMIVSDIISKNNEDDHVYVGELEEGLEGIYFKKLIKVSVEKLTRFISNTSENKVVSCFEYDTEVFAMSEYGELHRYNVMENRWVIESVVNLKQYQKGAGNELYVKKTL